MAIKIGRVSIPVFAIVAAIPRAIRRAAEVAKDDHDAASPGGAKVTPGEVAEVVLAFVSALGEEILPAVLKGNGL